MKTNSNRWNARNSFAVIEVVLWIVITFYARQQLDVAAAEWHIQALWLFLIKIGAVLALIAIAVALHTLVSRWLVKKGILPPEKPQS